MSILRHNGGSVLAMGGKNCVGIICDKRMGAEYATIDMNYSKIYEMSPTMYVGFGGLATDAITVSQRLKFRLNMFELRENRKMTPHIFTSMLSNMLYEKRFGPYFVEPIIAGLDENNQAYIASFDTIGCADVVNDFLAVGNATKQAFGMSEALWEPNLEPDALFETLSQAFLNAMDRDAKTGPGALVYIIEKDKVTISELKTRSD